MQYFKDPADGVYAIPSGGPTRLPAGSVSITKAEFDALTAPTPTDIAAAAQSAKDAADASAAKAYGKLTALKAMSPAEIQAWVAGNVTNLAQAQDAIATLAVGVGILARRL